jgi:predicted Ser/Thr protein kinase
MSIENLSLDLYVLYFEDGQMRKTPDNLTPHCNTLETLRSTLVNAMLAFVNTSETQEL